MRTVYTDGACSGNPGPGGWAWLVAPDGPWGAGAEARSTNQRMEVMAVLEAARSLSGPLEVVSDSTYVVNCFRDRWWEGWLTRGWLTKARKPVVSRDLWEPLIDLYRSEPGRLSFRWVKGHGTDPFNVAVDGLAVNAAVTQVEAAGDRLRDAGPSRADPPSTAPGPVAAGGPLTPHRRLTARTPVTADVSRPDSGDPAGESAGFQESAAAAPPAGDHPGRPARDPRLPAGRLVVAFGHRPPDLGGYAGNPVADGVRSKLAEVLAAKRQLHPDLHLLTGLALGAEQLAAEAAAAAGVPYVAVDPYPDPDQPWPPASRARYARLAGLSASRVLLEGKRPETKAEAGAALARRDAWLTRVADEALVVWDGDDPALGRLVRNLEAHLDADVWVVNPTGP